MSKFKVGDRARCFEGKFQVDGEVLNPNSDNESSQVIVLMKTATGREWLFNEKSCRKLVRKRRREFWVRECPGTEIVEIKSEQFVDNCETCKVIKVREVKE